MELDTLDQALKIIINEIINENKEYSLDDIYQKLESKNIKIKIYSPGVKIKDYLTNLVSLNVLSFKNHKYVVSEEYHSLLEIA